MRLYVALGISGLTAPEELVVPVDMVEAVYEIRDTTAFQDV